MTVMEGIIIFLSVCIIYAVVLWILYVKVKRRENDANTYK
jgi:cadmium resistance protein CadD (predicted permease)